MGELVLAFDTATAWTVVGASRGDDGPDAGYERGPAANGRPGHAKDLLALVRSALADIEADVAAVERIGVGVGPGSFTGLRIGVATGRGLAQATGIPVVPVSTLDALAWGPDAILPPAEPVLALVDARRGEVFAAAWVDGVRTLAPRTAKPDELAGLVAEHGAPVGDGAIRYREVLEQAGVGVPPDGDARHRVSAAALVALTRAGTAVSRQALLPDYIRKPDVDL